MKELSYGLRAQVLLNQYAFRNTHALGQNFLMDDGLLSHLLDLTSVSEGDCVLEIGPGAGVMTCLLAERAEQVLALEVDRHLEPVLSAMLLPFQNVRVAYQDVLKADVCALAGEAFSGGAFRVIANLPYYITADTITHLLLSGANITDICVMVQKEAAERMMSSPGEKGWGQFAATVRYFGDVEPLEAVPAGAFSPPPHVESLFIRIRLHPEKPVRPQDEALFFKVMQAAFLMRRKTMCNNLKAAFSVPSDVAKALLYAGGLSEQIRGEALNLNDLATLSDNLRRYFSNGKMWG